MMVNEIRAADVAQRSDVECPSGGQWENRKDDAAARGGCRHKVMYWSIAKQAPPLEQEMVGSVIADRFRQRPAKEIYNLRDRTRSAFSQLSLGFLDASKSNFIGYQDEQYSERRYRTAERNNRYAT